MLQNSKLKQNHLRDKIVGTVPPIVNIDLNC